MVIEWFKSFLSNWTFSLYIGQLYSKSASMICGFPQGSILGPVLFSLYMFPSGHISQRHGVSVHCNADDSLRCTHLYENRTEGQPSHYGSHKVIYGSHKLSL